MAREQEPGKRARRGRERRRVPSENEQEVLEGEEDAQERRRWASLRPEEVGAMRELERARRAEVAWATGSGGGEGQSQERRRRGKWRR